KDLMGSYKNSVSLVVIVHKQSQVSLLRCRMPEWYNQKACQSLVHSHLVVAATSMSTLYVPRHP
ncbi:hypothetical protein PanWU01x14_232380, partial [Parasponia andersonii]